MQKPNPLLWVPPPLFYVLAFLLGLLPERWWPTPARPGHPFDRVFFFLGLALLAAGVVLGPFNALRFLFKRTTLIPTRHPEVFFTGGVYRLSRNPMYLGLFLVYLGVAIVSWKLWPCATLIIPFLLIDRIVIPHEERLMTERFGKDYVDYCSRVGRWLIPR